MYIASKNLIKSEEEAVPWNVIFNKVFWGYMFNLNFMGKRLLIVIYIYKHDDTSLDCFISEQLW